MGLSHVPNTCKHVQHAQYMQTHPAVTALHTATDKQQNLTRVELGRMEWAKLEPSGVEWFRVEWSGVG